MDAVSKFSIFALACVALIIPWWASKRKQAQLKADYDFRMNRFQEDSAKQLREITTMNKTLSEILETLKSQKK